MRQKLVFAPGAFETGRFIKLLKTKKINLHSLHLYTDANGSDKVTGLYRPPGGRLVSGGEYDNHGDTENFFRFRYTNGPYKGVEISFVHVGGTHGGDVGGQHLGNFGGERNAMGSVRFGNIAGPGGQGNGYNHTHVKVFLNGQLTDPRKVFCKK